MLAICGYGFTACNLSFGTGDSLHLESPATPEVILKAIHGVKNQS